MTRADAQTRFGRCGMDEKVYKTMGITGGGTLAIGICVLVTGIASGVLLIISGAKLLKNRKRLMF